MATSIIAKQLLLPKFTRTCSKFICIFLDISSTLKNNFELRIQRNIK